MKKIFKLLTTSVLALCMVFGLSIATFADEPEGSDIYNSQYPISSDAPVILSWTDTTITIQTSYNREYYFQSVTGISSNWNVPSAEDYANGTYTFTNLQPGVGYTIYCRERGDESVGRPPYHELSEGSYIQLPVKFCGQITLETKDEYAQYMPAYVQITDANGNSIVGDERGLLTIYNGYFEAYLYVQQGTYNLTAYSSVDSTLKASGTITVPVRDLEDVKYPLTRETVETPTEAPTEAPTVAPTEAPTQAPTTAPTQAPTQAPTTKPTQAPTQAPTTKPTQAPTKEETTAEETTAESSVEETTEEITTVEETTAAPTEAPTPEQTTVVEATTAPSQPTSAPSGNMNWILVVGIAVVLIGLIGFAVYTVINK